MKHLKLFFALLAMLAINVGNAWGETVTYQHVFNQKPSTENSVTLSGVNWKVEATNLGNYNSQNYAGVQIGTSKKDGSITLTSVESWGASGTYKDKTKITEVRLWLNLGGTSVTPTVTIGGKSATSDGTKVVQNKEAVKDWTKATKVTFTPVADGNTGVVVINVSTVKAGYICAMEIDCEPASSGGGSTKPAPCTEPTVAWDTKPANGEVGGSMTASVTTNYSNGLTYSSSNPTVATVTNAGVINYLSAGTTTITATVTGDGTTICEGPVSVQQEITVTAAAGGGEGGTLSHTWDLSTNSYKDATTEQVTWSSDDDDDDVDNDVVKMIVEKGTAGTAANDYLGGTNGRTSSRFYQNSTLKIIHRYDVTVTSVVFTATTEEYATALQKSDWTNADATASGTTVTVTPNDPVVDITAPIGKTCDFTGVTVYYTKEPVIATLTLSKNGVAETFPGSWKQGDQVTLPSVTSDCVKEFVGWSANANCATEPEYKAGDEYTLASETQTLYAVYADIVEGGVVTIKHNVPSTGTSTNMTGNNDAEKFFGLNVNDWSIVSAKNGAQNHIGVNKDGTLRLYYHANGGSTLTITAPKDIASIVLNCNSSYKNAWVKVNDSPVTPVDGVYSINAKTVVIGNANTESKQVYVQSIEVTLAGELSNYSTTCVPALANPTFSLEEGKYTEAKSVTISAAEGTIYYTLDGTTPTVSSTQYTDAIALNDCGEYTIKAIAISNDSQSDVVSATYTIKLPLTNSEAAPYTEAEAIAVYDGGCYDNQDVYVKGTVNTATFNSSGTYTITLTDGFQFYKFYKTAGQELFADGAINAGDILVACGKLSKYNTTYQLAEGCYLVVHEPYTEPKVDISNDEATAYSVDKAFELIGDVSSDLTKTVYVKGLVAVAPTSNPNADGQMTYSISDNGETAGNVLKVYLGLGINGAKFTSKNDVQLGDYVVVKGQLLNYNGTYELNKGNQLVQHKKVATITIADITMEVDETKTIAATITPADASVTYAIKAGSDNCITLNVAEITATETGTATIVATIAETEDHFGATKEFTVTVTTPDTRKKAVSPSPFTAVSGDMTPNDITFASNKGGGTTGPNIKDNYIQLYQIASGKSYGGFITFNAVKGCKIDQVKIVTGNTTTTHIAYSVNDVMSPTTKNVAENAEYHTEAGLDAESVNIYCMQTNSENRLFIASAIVYYTGQPLADPELSWTSNAVELRVGEAFTTPTLNNPYNVTGITYSSDNESLAKVNETTGAVTLVPDATGTATIIATFDGNNTYNAAVVSYTITVKPALVSGIWELVTDVNSLAAGDKVVIVATDYDYALSTTQNDKNRGQAEVTKNNDNTVAFSKDVQVLTLEAGTVDNTFALNTGNGYLYASSSTSNQLKTQITKDANASWAITITDGTTSILAQGTNSNKTMQYNQSSSLFACYGSASQKALCLYRKKNIKVNENSDNTSIPNQSDVTVDNAELTVTTGAEYDNMYIGNNGTVKVETAVTINNLYIQTTMGTTTSGQLNTESQNLIVNGDVFIDITLGDNANPQKWHAFTVPFPVDAMHGVYDLDDKQLTNEVNYAIMDYHGDIRANGQYGWKKYRGILVPGTFYLMTVDGERNTYRFKKVKDAAIVAPVTKPITAYTGSSEDPKDKGWNGVGNPTLMHGKIAYDAQILNPVSYVYELIPGSDDYYFTVGTPFFIQADMDDEVSIVWATNNSLAPARRAAATVDKVKVMLGNADYTDYLYVSASEDATNEYEIGKDLAKMTMTKTPSVPQIFAEAYNTSLCMIDAPMANNEAVVALNLYAPADGEYTISTDLQENAIVYLMQEGTIVWNLSMGEYPITLKQGDNAGYSLLVRRADTPTSVETIQGANNQTDKLIHNGNLYILHNGKVFDAMGTMLK